MGSIRSVSYLEDLMVTASEDGIVKLWSISREKCERNIYGHQGRSLSLYIFFYIIIFICILFWVHN
jgi:hypothetical protein